MRPATRRQAGFTLIEVMIVLALTLMIAAIVYEMTRASWLLYRTETHVTERGFSGLRAVDDMTVEIVRAGLGLGDAGPLFPGTSTGARGTDAITLRSNPGGVAGVLQADLVERDQLVPVEGSVLFAVGDDVLLTDEERTLERAQVVRIEPGGSLAFRSLDGPEGRLRRPFLASLGARVLKVREVGFYLKTDSTGTVVLARKATGQAEQILARYVEELRFEYLDEMGGVMDLATIKPGRDPRAVHITLRLRPNPALPPVTVPPLSVLVSLEPQSAAIPFDAAAYHTIGLAAVVGQDPASGAKKVRMHAWRNTIPRF